MNELQHNKPNDVHVQTVRVKVYFPHLDEIRRFRVVEGRTTLDDFHSQLKSNSSTSERGERYLRIKYFNSRSNDWVRVYSEQQWQQIIKRQLLQAKCQDDDKETAHHRKSNKYLRLRVFNPRAQRQLHAQPSPLLTEQNGEAVKHRRCRRNSSIDISSVRMQRRPSAVVLLPLRPGVDLCDTDATAKASQQLQQLRHNQLTRDSSKRESTPSSCKPDQRIPLRVDTTRRSQRRHSIAQCHAHEKSSSMEENICSLDMLRQLREREAARQIENSVKEKRMEKKRALQCGSPDPVFACSARLEALSVSSSTSSPKDVWLQSPIST